MSKELGLERADEHRWVFTYPDMYGIDERFYKATDLMDSGRYSDAERIFLSILKKFPGHIDAIHHLSTIKRIWGENDKAFELAKKSSGDWQIVFSEKLQPRKGQA
jgi:hypothetical protein